jgi:uncharacterized protein YecE (DUF72 family)
MTSGGGSIHIGVGGWDYDPWRQSFYPPGLPKTKQLEHASRNLTATEVNATFYKLQSRDTWARWAAAVPDDFRFTIKASRFCMNRKQLATMGEAMEKFLSQGFTLLGDKLGPILWQLAPTKVFDAEDIAAFFALLPAHRDGRPLRHAIEPRNESFKCAEFVALARSASVAIVVADHDEYPQIADSTADFVYARLQRTREEEPAGYPPADLDRWAKTIRAWSKGSAPKGLNYICGHTAAAAEARPCEVFAFVISGAKVRNPLAAKQLIDRVQPKAAR